MWERGNPYMRMLTTFFTETGLKFNMTRLSYRRTDFTNFNETMHFAGDMALLYFVEPAMLALLVMAGGNDDDDDVGLVRHTVAQMLDTMPVLRELSGPMKGYQYSGTAGLSGVTAVIRAGNQIAQGEVDEAAIKSINQAFGNLFHYPSRVTNEMMKALIEGDPRYLVGYSPKGK